MQASFNILLLDFSFLYIAELSVNLPKLCPACNKIRCICIPHSCTTHISVSLQPDAINAYGCTPLHVACNNGQDVVVNILLQYNVSLNALNNRGQTPLHYAAYFPHGALCMELLVKSGADPNIQDIEGRTPLHMTAMFGFYLRTETLISHGESYLC